MSLKSYKLPIASVFYAINFVLAFRYGLWWLIYLATASVFYIIFSKNSLSQKLLYTVLANFLAILFSMHFVADTIINFSRIHSFYAYILLVLFSLFSTGSLVIFVLLSELFKGRLKYIMPIGILLAEFIDWKIFPWDFGSIFGYNIYYAQLANLIGSRGLSILAFLYGLLLFLGVKTFKSSKKNSYIYFSLFIALNIVQFFYGYYYIGSNNKKPIKRLNTLVVQANIGNSAKLSIEEKIKLINFLHNEHTSFRQDLILDTYIKMTEENLSKDTELIFWPETAFPARYRKDSYYTVKLKHFINKIQKPIIFGSYYGKGYKLFNTVIYQLPKQKPIIYKKHLLMPFGEYMPLGDTFPLLYRWFPDVSHFYRGKKQRFFKYKGIGILPIICYEAWFPKFIADKVKKDNVDFILHITNDSWFSRIGAKYHILFSKMRAIENNLPMLRVTNTGISTSIDRFGKILQKTNFDKQTTMKASIKIFKKHKTFYTKYGTSLLIIILGIYLLALLVLGGIYVRHTK